MKIIVIGDSHENTDAISLVRENYTEADYLIHCGDCCVDASKMHGFVTVEGNMDRPNQFPMYQIIECEPYSIVVIHGHTLISSQVTLRELAEYAKSYGCNVLIFGHIHMYIDLQYDGVRILSPGSVFDNRDGSAPSLMGIIIRPDGKMKVQRINYLDLVNTEESDHVRRYC